MADNISLSAPPDSLADLVAGFQRERAATADQREEIAARIRQTVTEIDRLTQLHGDLPSEVQQLEANIEAFPRAEILRIFAEARDAQMMQLTMQGQLGQLRNRETDLERVGGMLDRFLVAIESLGGTPAEMVLQSIELAHQRISRQLQDVTAQALTDLMLRAEICQRLLDRNEPQAREEVAGIRVAAGAALSTRRLFYELQPPTLEELGLVATLSRYVESCGAADHTRIDLQVSGQERRLSAAVELGVFRIVQEAITNSARHSGAGRAEVRLCFDPNQLIATVADQGQGFDVESTLAGAARRNHSGLGDLQLRAHLIDGILEISSRSGGGCMISLAVPA